MAIAITIISGEDPVPLQAPDGSYNVVDATADEDTGSIYHPSGAYRVTFVDGSSNVSLYAPNGSLNLVDVTSSPSDKIYHPCGAYQAVVIDDQTEEDEE